MRLLIVVNVDWFFISHRLPVGLGALKAGHEVHIATTLTRGEIDLEKYGFIVHPIDLDRSSASFFGILKLLFNLLHLFWTIKPEVLHLVTIKPVLIGGLAARFAPVGGIVFAISGLGHVFVADGLWGKLRRSLVGAWYKFVLSKEKMCVIFQNPDDKKIFKTITHLKDEKTLLIPGSGVNLSEYTYTPLPSGEKIVLMAARLLKTKGTREFVSAAKKLHESGVKARFWLVGDPDPENPASIAPKELENWYFRKEVEFFGHRSDMPLLMSKAHIVVLPSYREGLPKVLIEAAACGRAVVTTDVPGCRDAIINGVTGLLVPPKDAVALAKAIQKLLDDPETCRSMGNAGRRRAEAIFNVDSVVDAHLKVYQSLANRA